MYKDREEADRIRREKTKKRVQAYYQRNPEVRKSLKKAEKNKFRSRKIRFVKLMGGKCIKCGYDKNLYCLEFHHHEKKDFVISSMFSMSEINISKEIVKCEILCRNCHFDHHHPLGQNWK